ncbi:MAG: cobalt transporter [Oscillospiraceae bacterium]|nr:cobalt transporter [Oscillospiraceae bacterium]
MHDHGDHTHPHAHTHPDGGEHGAAHTHEHSHADGRIHTHEHTHDGAHAHAHPGGEGLGQTAGLLKSMLEHNEHHAEELAGLLDSLPPKAKNRLLLAIGTFEAANTELKAVLDCIEGS